MFALPTVQFARFVCTFFSHFCAPPVCFGLCHRNTITVRLVSPANKSLWLLQISGGLFTCVSLIFVSVRLSIPCATDCGKSIFICSISQPILVSVLKTWLFYFYLPRPFRHNKILETWTFQELELCQLFIKIIFLLHCNMPLRNFSKTCIIQFILHLFFIYFLTRDIFIQAV